MMKKLSLALIAVLIILVGYNHFYLNDQSSIMKSVFKLNSNHPLIINLPESNLAVTLDKKVTQDKQIWLKGSYTQGEERGTVLLDVNKMLSLLQHSENEQYFVAPFTVSNQGSGIFYYLGLFERNNNKISHLSSYFLGDRITINNISTWHDSIDVIAKPRDSDQEHIIAIKVRHAPLTLTDRDNR